MKVCIDIQAAVDQRAGVGRYTRALVEGLAAFKGDDEVSLFCFDFTRRGDRFLVPGTRRNAVRWFPGRVAQALWKTVGCPPFNWFSGRADVYHFPNFIIPPLSSGKTVVTIHDVSFIRHAAFTEAGNLSYLKSRMADTVRRADAIITDSAFSAGEIMGLLQAPADRVIPIPLGLSEHITRPSAEAITRFRAENRLERPYLLMVGTLEPRKNHAFLIRLFERLTDFDGDLVIAGMRGWHDAAILEQMRRSPRAAAIRYVEYVPDSDLPALYAGAELFLFPSFYEGFGFPPLEAMRCGVPVISSTGGSLAEVLGAGARLIATYDLDAWIAEIRQILGSATARKTLIDSGGRQAAHFSWAETARQTWAVYRKVCA